MESVLMVVTESVAESVPDRQFRQPGCGVDCRVLRALLPGQFGRSEILLHDPGAHEDFGRRSAGWRPDATDVFVTGRLTVDLSRWEASIDGVPVHLSPTELKLLRALAARAGAVVTAPDLYRELWGTPYDDRSGRGGNAHLIRVMIARLRRRLGPDETLVRTVIGIGYRLEVVEPGLTLPAQPRNPFWKRRLTTWARDWTACRGCGTTERAHKAHGYCWICGRREERQTSS
jgi:DNA-binding winged helix-turn-helix (wHTH) protein